MKRRLWILSGLLAIALAAATWLVMTSGGLRLVLHAAARLSDVELEYSSVSGSLFSGAEIEDMQVLSGSFVVESRRVSAQCRCTRLAFGALHLSSLEAVGLRVQLPDPAPGAPFAPAIPPVTIEAVRVRGIEIITADGSEPRTVDELRFGMVADDDLVVIADLYLNTGTYGLRGAARFSTLAPFDVNAHFSWKGIAPDGGAVKGRTVIAGHLDRLQLDATLDRPLQLNVAAVVSDPFGALNWTGSVEAPFIDSTAVTLAPPGILEDVRLHGSGTLDDAQLEGSFRFTGQSGPGAGTPRSPGTVTLQASARKDGESAVIEAGLDWTDLGWHAADLDFGSPDGRVRFNLRGEAVELDGRAQLSVPGMVSGNVTLNASGNLHGTLTGEILAENEFGQVSARIRQRLLPDPELEHLALMWDRLNIPAGENRHVVLEDGTAGISGALDDYRIDLNSGVRAAPLPPVHLQLAARGNLKGLVGDSYIANTLGGSVEGSFGMQWHDGIVLSLNWAGAGLDPGDYWRDWPGRLDTSGRLHYRAPAQGVGELRISARTEGTIRSLPARAIIETAAAGDDVDLQHLELASGSARIEASGHVGDSISLDWRLDVPDFSDLHPDAEGSLAGHGSVSGLRISPRIRGKVEANDMHTPWLSLDRVTGRADLGSAADAPFELALDLTGAATGGKRFDAAELYVSGSARTHRGSFALRSGSDAVDGALSGSLAKGTWVGSIFDVTAESSVLGAWRSSRGFDAQFSERRLSVTGGCLEKEAAVVCAGGTADTSGNWTIATKVQTLPVAWLAAARGLDLEMDSTFDARLEASGRGLVPGDAEGAASITGSRFTYHAGDGETEEIILSGGNAALDFDGDAATASVELDFAGGTLEPIRARWSVSGLADPDRALKDAPIDGYLKAGIRDLALLSNLSPAVSEVRGSAGADLEFEGTAETPRMAGTFRVRDSEMYIPDLGVQITGIDLEGRDIAPGEYRILGTATSEGVLNLAANLRDVRRRPRLGMNIEGSGFEVVNLPEVRAFISPDLDLVLSPADYSLMGSTLISNADINLDEVVITTPISEDAVFVNEAAPKEPPFVRKLKTDLVVELGDDVTVRGRGINGRLTGRLHLSSGHGERIIANGEVSIVEGTFTAYGQSLEIDEGRAIYNQARLDNPEIRIRAVRRVGDVAAGVSVAGTLTDPIVGLFSTPSMSQEQILSYVVFGRPLSGLTSDQGTSLVGAAAAMGLRNSGVITGKLSSRFGLDELSVSTGETVRSASLVIGKYLTPRLYLSYGIGLFEHLNSARLRYDFTQRWSVQAERGAEMGLDVFYKLER